jgi:hypothetical protein
MQEENRRSAEGNVAANYPASRQNPIGGHPGKRNANHSQASL